MVAYKRGIVKRLGCSQARVGQGSTPQNAWANGATVSDFTIYNPWSRQNIQRIAAHKGAPLNDSKSSICHGMVVCCTSESLYCIQLNMGQKGSHCIVFWFTFYRASQLFWNQGRRSDSRDLNGWSWYKVREPGNREGWEDETFSSPLGFGGRQLQLYVCVCLCMCVLWLSSGSH